MKRLAAILGALGALAAAAQARADSGTGGDTVLGNALHPSPAGAMPDPDPGGRGIRERTHSPAGLPNGEPRQVHDPQPAAGGWQVAGSVEAGILGGTDSSAERFREYRDLGNGPHLRTFSLDLVRPDRAWFVEARGGGAGRDDQFYGLAFGRYNDWKVQAFYQGTPHVFSTTFKALYADNGTGRPALDNGTPGGAGATTPAALGAYARSLSDSEVGLLRRKGGLRADWRLGPSWQAYAAASHEDRRGRRPLGLQEGNVEGIEPIDHRTVDLAAGLHYGDRLTTASLRASASLFGNDIAVLHARRALAAAEAAPATLAAQDFSAYTLPPDNQAYQLKGEFARRLPGLFQGRLTAGLAWSTARQDEPLRLPLDPSASAAMGGNAGVPAAAASGNVAFDPRDWNGANGSPLSRRTAGQRIDTTLAQLALALKPLPDLALKAALRHHEADNRSGTYYAYNPLTGQWGPGIEQTTTFVAVAAPDGLGGCQPAPGFTAAAGCTATNAQIAALFGHARALAAPPSSRKQTQYALTADYGLGRGRSLAGTLEREDTARTYRERDKTWEDRLRLAYTDRSFAAATLRASVEHDRKRGSFYDPLVTARLGQGWFAIYGVPYSRGALQELLARAGSGGIYPSLADIQGWLLLSDAANSGGWMKPDQADRDRDRLDLRLNYALRPDLDLGAAARFAATRYPANSRGPQRDQQASWNLDLHYRPAATTQVTAFHSLLVGRQRQVENYGSVTGTGFASLTAYATSICGTLSSHPTLATVDCLLGAQRIPSSDVTVDTRSTNHVLGVGVSRQFRTLRLRGQYTYARGVTAIDRLFGPTALTPAEQAVEAGAGPYPDLKTAQHGLQFDLWAPIDRGTAVHLLYRHERWSVRDWHYAYYPIVAAGTFIPADLGPRDYRADVLGVLLSFRL